MNCPRCRVELNKVQVTGIEIDLCKDCHGVWFDSDELERVFTVFGPELGQTQLAPSLEEKPKTLAGDEREGQNELACPRCGAVLARRKYDSELSVLVDGCEKGCGLWLDSGELGQIAQHIAKQRNLDNPEQESELLLKIIQAESAAEKREKDTIDQMAVKMKLVSDNENSSGIAKRLGMAIRGLYKALYKIGG
jgi:hypothetical protein